MLFASDGNQIAVRVIASIVMGVIFGIVGVALAIPVASWAFVWVIPVGLAVGAGTMIWMITKPAAT